MPRNVRNFWLELDVDGKSTRVETGPVAKDGGFTLRILQRDKGGIISAMRITGREGDGGIPGRLVLEAEIGHDSNDEDTGYRAIQVITER